MKRLSTFVFMIVVCLICAAPAIAENAPAIPDHRLCERLADNANLLDEVERQALLEQLDEISNRQNFDVVIVTENSLGGKTPMQYADDFYDYNGYGFGESADGCLLLLDMGGRNWYLSTCGSGINIITDSGREYMAEQFLPYFQNGDYTEGFRVFAGLCDEYIDAAKSGTTYESVQRKQNTPWLKWIVAALVAGMTVGFVPVSIMKSKLKSVKFETEAANYIKDGSMKVSVSRDTYLYSTVSRTAKPQDSGGSSVHTSSSGQSHGGGGGSF